MLKNEKDNKGQIPNHSPQSVKIKKEQFYNVSPKTN